MKQVVKRDGRVVDFAATKIENAITACLREDPNLYPDDDAIEAMVHVTMEFVAAKLGLQPTVEQVQQAAITSMIEAGDSRAAVRYAEYKGRHDALRGRDIPVEVRKAYDSNKKWFPTALQEFQYLSKYARWDAKLGRREVWEETIDRVMTGFDGIVRRQGSKFSYVGQRVDLEGAWARQRDDIRHGVLSMKALCSMRYLAMAGPAMDRNNISSFNCAYLGIDNPYAMVELLVMLMCGSGVGFSVEAQFIDQLPKVGDGTMAEKRVHDDDTWIYGDIEGARMHDLHAPVTHHEGLHGRREHEVEDTSAGWASALSTGLCHWWNGMDHLDFDFSLVRPAGAKLLTKGGTASGPEPLKRLLAFARETILAARGRKLTSVEVYDLVCMIADCVVCGGVRRCLPAGTKVHLRRGLVPIEQVRPGEHVLSARGEYQRVTRTFDQGVQDLVRVTTENGTDFLCTANHRVAVLADAYGDYDWREAGQLQPDDRLMFVPTAVEGEDGEWRSSEHPRYGQGDQSTDFAELEPFREADKIRQEISQPTITNVETAWVLGKLFADGCVQATPQTGKKSLKHSVTFACHSEDEQDQMARIVAWAEDHGIRATIMKKKGEKCSIVRISNRRISRLLFQYKQPNTPLVVPDFLWTAPTASRAAFVAGVFDGDGSDDRPLALCATVYEGFARDLVRLCASLGIVTTLRVNKNRPEGWQPLWWVHTKAQGRAVAEELVRPLSCKWRSGPRTTRQSGYTIPGEMVRAAFRHKEYKHLWPGTRGTDMNSEAVAELTGATDFIPVKVRSVEAAHAAPTYDIEVENTHCFVAEGYLVHNSALLCMFDWEDQDMRDAKASPTWLDDTPWRQNSNNSAVQPDRRLSQAEIDGMFAHMYRTSSGEPGFISRRAGVMTMPKRRRMAMTEDELAQMGFNPCVPADTWVMTTEGPRQVSDLIDTPFTALVDGKPYQCKTGFWKTGDKTTFELKTTHGYTVRATGNHKFLVKSGTSSTGCQWRELRDIKPGDKVKMVNHRESPEWGGRGTEDEGWLLGSLYGDGTLGDRYAYLDYWGDDREEMASHARNLLNTLGIPATSKSQIRDHEGKPRQLRSGSHGLKELAEEYGLVGRDGRKKLDDSSKVERTSSAFHRGFLRGWFDADGGPQISTLKDGRVAGRSVRLCSNNPLGLAIAQRMLARLGLISSIVGRRPEGDYELPDGRGGTKMYHCKEVSDLIVQGDDVGRFKTTIGYTHECKTARHDGIVSTYIRGPQKRDFMLKVKSVTPSKAEMVYDCTVLEKHVFDGNGFYAHQCVEILLKHQGFCNLSIAVARAGDTLEDLAAKVRIATIMGTLQACCTKFRGLRKAWTTNAEEERLIGVDITGQQDRPCTPEELAYLRTVVAETNRKWSALLGINVAAAMTCNKPSGNSSVLLNCSPGINPRPGGAQNIRNVTVGAATAMYRVLADAGVRMAAKAGSGQNVTQWIASFPQKADDPTVTPTIPAMEQLRIWKNNKVHWCEHNPSCTINVKQLELLDVGQWLYENQDIASGLAFFPAWEGSNTTVYTNMPYVPLTPEAYEEFVESFPEIDFARLYRYETDDETTAATELACSGGQCLIEF